ncbi:MAG: hypothetical protein KJ000_23065 [Pirellulaceae bacterium]|nr:hypothetical protein [Pirellulaceae bacterium]
MNNDPYLDAIKNVWEEILLVYDTFRDKEQIIEFDVSDRKIYSYPAGDYIQQLSERSRESTLRLFADITKCNKFLLFVKDSQNRRLRSYVFDLPE